jgi:hypothetical protein
MVPHVRAKTVLTDVKRTPELVAAAAVNAAQMPPHRCRIALQAASVSNIHQ